MEEMMVSLWWPDILTPLRWELHPGRFHTEWWPEGKSMWRSRNKAVEQFVLTSKLSETLHLDKKKIHVTAVCPLSKYKVRQCTDSFCSKCFLPENKHIIKFSREVKMTFKQAEYRCFFKAGPWCLSESITEDSNSTLTLFKMKPCGLSHCHSPNIQCGDIDQRKQVVMFHQALRTQEGTTICRVTSSGTLLIKQVMN